MSDVTLTPNMSLPLPIVGQDPGPTYGDDQNAAFSLVDSHDHSAGKGVQVTPDGLSISADLPFGGNNATLLRSVRFSPQGAALSDPSDLGCLYEVGVDLYFNDGLGNQIPITANGGIAGSPGSISNLTSPASAAYVAGTETFVWQSDVNTPANMDGGSVLVRQVLANAKYVKISSPTSLAANYEVFLPPALPSAQKLVTLDNSGNIAAAWVPDATSIKVTANVVQVGPQASINSAVDSGTTNVINTNVPTHITSLAVTVAAATGRPLYIRVNFSAGDVLTSSAPAGAHTVAALYLARGSTILDSRIAQVNNQTNTDPSSFMFVDPIPGTGSVTYNIYATGVAWITTSSTATMTVYGV